MSSLGREIDAYLAEVVARLAGALGPRLVGVWLFGSAALGDFDPARSDLDVQAVATERLPRAEREALAAMLSNEALPCPVRGLELVLYAREDLADPAFQLNLNTGPGMEHHVTFDPREDPRFWFAIDVAIGREAGVPLSGPPPDQVFPPLPRALVLGALADALTWWRARDPPGAVLAACRAWAWAVEGRWLTKAAAAAWAADRLADPEPVRAAWARRADPAAAPPSPGGVAALLDRVDAVLTS